MPYRHLAIYIHNINMATGLYVAIATLLNQSQNS